MPREGPGTQRGLIKHGKEPRLGDQGRPPRRDGLVQGGCGRPACTEAPPSPRELGSLSSPLGAWVSTSITGAPDGHLAGVWRFTGGAGLKPLDPLPLAQPRGQLHQAPRSLLETALASPRPTGPEPAL